MNSYSILVVDDEPDNFEVIEALLESMNYTLHYASHGQEAISSLDKFDPDLILLDVMMPGIDGIEVCKQIKSMSEWQAVPIIMVTALTSANDLARCLSAGADDFVSKPINGVELRARVHSMLRIKKQHDRIESLSKLQRNSIHSLKSSLDELNLDLAVSFSNELDAPLNNILNTICLLQRNFPGMKVAEISEMLESANQSAVQLNQFKQEFLFARQLSPSISEPKKQKACASKISIKQLAIKQSEQLQSSPKLIFDIEDTELAITPKHLQYIINELLDCILQVSEPQTSINIYGHVMNGEFHFYMDNRKIALNSNYNTKLLKSIQFNPGSNSEQELSVGLKIAKKIVEVHDGIFLIASNDKSETTIYITLPLVGATSLRPLPNNSVIHYSSAGRIG